MGEKYDIVIVAHEKDFNNIKFIVENAVKNLTFDSIHLILSERTEYKDLDTLKTYTNKPIRVHKESDVLIVEKSKLGYRPNWIYQMFLKIFQDVTENDNFLIIESDTIILKPLSFFEGGKTIFYLGRDQNHKPYFDFNHKVFGFGREYPHSFISEFLMYDKKIVKNMLQLLECETPNDFMEIVYKNTNPNCYPADYELYGNFVAKYHKDKFTTKKLNSNFFGRRFEVSPFWSNNEISDLIYKSDGKDALSFHTWKV